MSTGIIYLFIFSALYTKELRWPFPIQHPLLPCYGVKGVWHNGKKELISIPYCTVIQYIVYIYM